MEGLRGGLLGNQSANMNQVQVTPLAASEVVFFPQEPAYGWSMVHGTWWPKC